MENNLNLQSAGTIAVKQLRINKLRNGMPFMINSRDLPGNQCYMEYPDSTIKLVILSSSRMDFDIIRVLTEKECNELRQKYKLADA